MKIGVAITTIHPPASLDMLFKCAGSLDVRFFIACDRRTPDLSYLENDNVHVLATADQAKWKCSEALTWNSLARRNTAFLEAIRWGSDIVIAHDVDNYPTDAGFFYHFARVLQYRFNGIRIDGKDRWFDPGQYLVPKAAARGFPMQRKHRPHYTPVVDAKVGIASGLIINEPDIDAITRMVQQPTVGDVALLAQTGCVVDTKTWTVYNTQNSAAIRELMPAWFLMPGVGRMDDIYAGLVVQRVARERGYHVHFGQPFVLQERHDHDLIVDLKAEIDGYSNVIKLADLLDSIILPAKSVIEDTRIIYQQLCHCSFIPEASARAGLLWLEDCEGVM